MRFLPFIVAGAAGLSLWLHAGAAKAGSEAVLYSFKNAADGSGPFAGITADGGGNLYGAAQEGGGGGGLGGVVFKISVKGAFRTLHAFTGGADGEVPQGTPVLLDGVLYGTSEATVVNGSGTAGGSIYKVTTAGTETTLATLTGTFGNKYGEGPAAGLLRIGNAFYGVAAFGGKAGNGTVFKIDTAGQIKLIYAFAGGNDGAYPFGTLVADSSNNLYGVTRSGGVNGDGVIFEVTPSTGTEKILYSFAGGSDGSEPIGGLVFDGQGNLYGTTVAGGTYNNGTVFELPAGGTEKVIYTFLGGNDGASPYGTLVINAQNQLVGTTSAGGMEDAGTVFAVTPAGVETQLYSFTGGADGMAPYAGLLLTKAGNYIGTTFGGGTHGYGTVFEIMP
jgi:uncharacterized repeat protein (TIGR03803 family)